MINAVKKLSAIIRKELRSQMRGGRAFFLLGAYLVLLIGFEWCIANVFLVNSERMGAESYKMGFVLFTTLSLFQLLFISFLTPGFTSGSVSREKEQQTFDLLVTSDIPPISLITGKLVASLGYIFLLVVSSIPVMSTAFLFGSVSLEDFLATYSILIITAITFGSIGLFFSSLVKKTQVATALTYGTIMFMTIATLIGGSLANTYLSKQMMGGPWPAKAETIEKRRSYKTAKFLLRLSPINAMTSITGMTPETYHTPYGNPYSLLLVPMPQFELERMIFEAKMHRGPLQPQKEELQRRPDWQYTAIIYLSLSAALIFISSRLLLPYRRWRIKLPLLRQ